jgi:hypothetical protein
MIEKLSEIGEWVNEWLENWVRVMSVLMNDWEIESEWWVSEWMIVEIEWEWWVSEWMIDKLSESDERENEWLENWVRVMSVWMNDWEIE